MSGKLKIAGIVTGVVLLIGVPSWVSTAPYAGNQGLSRTPGVIIGGTDTPAPSDFSTVNDVGTNLLMKQAGFPPFVIYLTYVGTPEGVITHPPGRGLLGAADKRRQNGWAATHR